MRRSFLQLGLAAAAILALNACGLFSPRTGENALVGAWTNPLGTVWTIKADGTFDVDLNHNGQRDAWGNYTISGEMITLTRTGGLNPKGCDRKGVYRFARVNDTLQFTLFQDDCKLRKKNMLLGWKRRR
jgi:hypothetical protein